ncbi:unnamed protein product [Peronospora farinosa]|uniref:Reverse transcriptase Ty1/copia-type domain-containing protein n=1 Tax=Peronospora farinosa TaxID=134698 RepID=A0AAV0UCA0_9STRA|nr:unnamed protein product [Peronospora farinosa]
MQYVIRQFDVETAFLNGDLEEDVYMEAPYGIEIAPGMVRKLRRSLYGLKQAAAVWHKKICSVFSAMGFEQCRADTCLFVRRNNAKNKSPTYIVLYVDDLLIGCKSDAEADTIYKELSEHFTVKSLGAARFILGMEVNYSQEKGELVLKQSQFIMKVVSKFKQNEAYAVRNPICAGQDLTPDESHPVVKDITSYRKLVGSLLYITNATRPDISYAMSVLSQYLDQPRQMHGRAALRVLHYLMGTKSHGIKYSKSDDKKMMLWAYCDANWGNDKKTRRSTSGVLILLGGAAVVYKSKRQSSVALSSAEAEYMALALATQEVMWIRYLLKEMGVTCKTATTVHMDNKSAISIATNQGYTPRAKHIDLRMHFVRDHIEQGDIQLKHVPSAMQLADYLTKPLGAPQLMRLRDETGIRESAS